MNAMLNTDAVYEDRDCGVILMTLVEQDQMALEDIEVWVRLVSWSYFTSPEQKSKLDYDKDVVTPEEWKRVYLNFLLTGLFRMDVERKGTVVCKPMRIVERWTEGARANTKERIAKAKVARKTRPASTKKEKRELVAA